jgi:hypothetical protein
MHALPFPDTQFMQFAWVVPDVRAAAEEWARSAGVGPFFLFEHVSWDSPIYRGKPWEAIDITAAIAQAGHLQIELISQNEEGRSMFRDVVPAGQSGLHHAALYCKDYDATLGSYKRAGAEVAFSGLMMGFPVCWVEPKPSLGFMVELITANPVADAVFAQFRTAAGNWDGRDPLRTLG